MKSFLKHLLCGISLCSFLCSSFPCSLVIAPIRGFDAQEFIFIGQVVGYVGPYEGKGVANKAWGVRVSIKDKVFLPQMPSSGHFEVFSYGLGADCSPEGMGEDITKQALPLNSEVRIIAKIAHYLPSNLTNGDMRLEVSPFDYGALDRNDRNQKPDTTSTSTFKYVPNLNLYDPRVIFEIKKDLVRLERAKASKERKSILQRLEPLRHHRIIDYELISAYYDKEIEVGTKIRPRQKQ